MYLSVTTIVLGELLLTRSLALLTYWVIWFAAVNLFVIGYEEPTLSPIWRFVRAVHPNGWALDPHLPLPRGRQLTSRGRQNSHSR